MGIVWVIIGIKISPKNNELKKERLGPAKALYFAVKETFFVILDSIVSIDKGSAAANTIASPSLSTSDTLLGKFSTLFFL